jgi:hypothetical protein
MPGIDGHTLPDMNQLLPMTSRRRAEILAEAQRGQDAERRAALARLRELAAGRAGREFAAGRTGREFAAGRAA